MAVQDDYARIGAVLRAAREGLGYTQLQVASEIGVSEATYSRYEAGKQKISIPELRQVSAMLGMRAGSLVNGAADETFARPVGSYGSLDDAPVADWLKDPDLRVMFYGITRDLTPEEIESIKPILWKEYLAILARREEAHAGGGPAGAGDSP